MQIDNKSYEVVYDPELADNHVAIPSEISEELLELHEKSKKGKQSIKPRLLKLIKRYPKLPFLKNYLITWHIVNNNKIEAVMLNDELLAEFPEYIFAKTIKIDEMIKEGKIAEAGALLNNKFSIEELYPERKAFHLSEFRAFSRAAVCFLAASYRFDEAEAQIDLLKQVEINDDAVSELEMLVMKYKLERGKQKMQEYEKLKIRAAERLEPTLPARDIEMKPQHILFEYLYGDQWVLDEALLKEHFINNKEQLISEFQHILRTAVEGYTFIAERREWNAAMLHAFLIFPYLDEEAALPSILEFYRQPYEISDYWLMDWDTELMSVFFKRFSTSKLQQLFNFLTESPGVRYNKITLLSLLPLFAIQLPGTRDTLVTFIRSVLEFFIANRHDENLFDSDVIAFAISAATDLKATELLEIIKELFDKGWVSLDVGGDFEEVSNRMCREDGILENTFYDDVFTHIRTLRKKDQEDEERRQAEYEEKFRKDIAKIINKHKTVNGAGGQFNVSRNSPCPCGSGKKFKRCHGK